MMQVTSFANVVSLVLIFVFEKHLMFSKANPTTLCQSLIC